ncbi:MAG: ABC transporter ATP-binding protein [Bacillota bacterium]|jgi:branched-chain amino acid transport system ATP-binding protein
MALLETKQLSVHFGGVVAVDRLDMAIEPGEILGLIGPNGAGKTTTLNLLSGYLLPSHGRLHFKGQDITGLQPHEVASLGLVRTFQKSAVFGDVTVLENLIIATHLHSRSSLFEILTRNGSFQRREKAAEEKAKELLCFFGLWEKRDQLARHLSYGERRLLELAISLAPDPDLILLDEPAAGMNPEEGARLADLIRLLREKGLTILLVEHHMDLIMSVSDRIIVLNHGVKIAEGEPSEVQCNKDVIDAYLGGVAFDA